MKRNRTRGFCTEGAAIAQPPYSGILPGSLMRPERGPSGLCTIVRVQRPSARVRRIAERGPRAAPEPRYWTLDIAMEPYGAVLRVETTWWDVHGEQLC